MRQKVKYKDREIGGLFWLTSPLSEQWKRWQNQTIVLLGKDCANVWKLAKKIENLSGSFMFNLYFLIYDTHLHIKLKELNFVHLYI